MMFNCILMHQIYCAEYFGTTLLSPGFVAKMQVGILIGYLCNKIWTSSITINHNFDQLLAIPF